MNQKTLHINGKDYAVKFGFKANRILADKWNLTSITQVSKKLFSGFKAKAKSDPELTFEQYELFAELVIAGIHSLDPKVKLLKDDVLDVIFQDVGKFQEMMKLYTDSMPKAPKTPEPSKNVKRVKK